MSTLMSLFTRRKFSLPSDDAFITSMANETSGNAKDLATFGSLGASQQSIEYVLESVQQGLNGVQALVEQAAVLKTDLAKSFDEHRMVALENSVLRQERDQIQQRLTEKVEQHKTTYAELVSLQAETEDVRRGYERTRTDLDALEHRHHLLGVAKRETEDQLDRYVNQLAVANEEVENLRIAASSLQDIVDDYKTQIADLNARFNESNHKSLLLANQCEALENALQQKFDEIVLINENYDLIFKEKEDLLVYSRQKEQELLSLRADVSRMFQQNQADKKTRDSTINQLQADLDRARANIKMLEDVNDETSTENKRLVLEVTRLGELAELSGVKVARLEASAERLNAKLEATLEAKGQIEQSRATMAARLEAMTQLLAEREVEAKRFADEVTRLASQVERDSAVSKDVVENLEMKIHELEKELSAQRNEATFFASQLQAAQRKGPQTIAL